MERDATIRVLLTGDGMSPGKIRSKEIAEVIESVEEMIASVVLRDNPTLKKDSIVIGLRSIQQGSIGLEFTPNIEELTLPAMYQIADSIVRNSFIALPSGTISSLRKLSVFSRKHNCDAEFFAQNGKLEKLAILTPKTHIPEILPLSGETTIYGEITRVGGSEPKIQFKTFDGHIIYCSTSKMIAKKAGTKLYTKVKLSGLAKCSPETYEIEDFHVIDIFDHEKTSLSDTFKDLTELFGSSFDKIENVERFTSEIRNGILEA